MGDIVKTITHAGVQSFVGVLSGGVIDALMPGQQERGAENEMWGFAQMGAEISVQLALDSLFAAGVSKALGKVGIKDPANGFAFIAAVLASQPTLMEKMGRMGHAIRLKVLRLDGGQLSPKTYPSGLPRPNRTFSSRSVQRDVQRNLGVY